MVMNFKSEDPNYLQEKEKYPDPIPSREFILLTLKKAGKAMTREQLLRQFHLQTEAQLEAFRRRLIAMERDGQLMRNRRGKYALVDQLNLVRGRVIGHKEGFGFLAPDQGGDDIYLSPYQMRGLFPGDVILVRVSQNRGRREGVLVEILERHTQTIVGRLCIEGKLCFVHPHDKDTPQDIAIAPDDLNGAKNGQFVEVAIIEQPSARRQAMGRVIEVLGDELQPGMEIELAIRAHNIPYLLPEEIAAEAAEFSLQIPKKEIQRRLNLRQLPFVTIDGEDAKDFDDAVYAEKIKTGWRLYVAIADVSYYVTPKTALDKEAEARGNSVYFPGRVVPMLPEILSNELCSLKPQVDRLVLVCIMQLDAKGKVTRYQFEEAVIHSAARLTYNEVSQVISGKKKNHPQIKTLEPLYKLYLQLLKQRKERGALDFDTEETRIIFTDKKKIKSIVPVVRNEAHRLIEECMLQANVCAAKFLHKNKTPALYRVHEVPSKEKIQNLTEFLKGLGMRVTLPPKPDAKDYAKLIERSKSRPDTHLIQTVMLRSLMQAKYSPDNKGHFGLYYKYYTHFTSPIRRYPDLSVHRAIKSILNEKKSDKTLLNKKELYKLGEHCSMTERRADEATRDATQSLKCFFMKDKIGETFDAIISGVVGFGVFVEIKQFKVEGLVHVTALGDDYYQFDPKRFLLQGKTTGKKYRLGDQIRVRLLRVDVDDRNMDFELV